MRCFSHIPFSVNFLIGFVGALLVYVIWHSVLTKGWRRSLGMFLLSFLVAFTAEALGVNFGLIFGTYYYPPALGVQLFGVPFLAALPGTDRLRFFFYYRYPGAFAGRPSLFLAEALACLRVDGGDRCPGHHRLGYDDRPIAVSQGWWVWEHGGNYLPYLANGVPIQNFLGWLSVAFVINLIYRLVVDGEPTPPVFGPFNLRAADLVFCPFSYPRLGSH